MHRLTITILVNDQPLKRAYVEHIWTFGISGPLGLYMTDNRGRFSFNSQTSQADIRILGQNSVARIVEGNGALFVADIWVDKKVDNRTTIRLDTSDEKAAQFQILNQALEHYDTCHRTFEPFSRLPHPDFPLGRESTLQRTKDKAQRIEIVYPDNLPQRLAFVEPKSFRTGYPLVHLKGPGQGAADGSSPLAEEFAHALHFANLDDARRGDVELNYARWLLGQIAEGGDAGHGFSIQTTAMVAYIEAFGLFGTRFARFRASSASNAGLSGAALHKAFVQAELERSDANRIIAARDPTIQPAFQRDDVEGAVFGAIFVHFASLTSLGAAVEAVYRSQAVTFDAYRDWVVGNMPQHRAAIESVERVWGM